MDAFNTLVNKLNNKVLIAIIVALFLYGIVRRFIHR
jgi:hypothetical protein